MYLIYMYLMQVQRSLTAVLEGGDGLRGELACAQRKRYR